MDGWMDEEGRERKRDRRSSEFSDLETTVLGELSGWFESGLVKLSKLRVK